MDVDATSVPTLETRSGPARSSSARRHRRLLAAALSGLLVALGMVSVALADTVPVVGAASGALATATVTCEFNAQTNTATFTVRNTSPHDARITGIGFDLPPAGNASASGLNGFTGNVAFQPTGVSFTFSDADLGGVPGFGGNRLDFGFLTGANFATGMAAAGLPPGTDPGDEATFVVSGAAFAGFTEEQICNAVLVRFEGVGAAGTGTDVGFRSVAGPQPVLSAVGFACSPRGSLPGSPTTTKSVVIVDAAAPSRSVLLCSFPGSVLTSPLGGPCAFENAAIRVDFSRRLFVNLFGGGGRLICWDGTTTIKT